MSLLRPLLAFLFLPFLFVLLSLPPVLSQEPPPDPQLDLAPYVDLAKHVVKPTPPSTDPKTGFIVAGKNDSKTILSLTEINSLPVADLEKDMRPGAESDVGSRLGFLGADESLLAVLAADNDYVVGELGLTHQEVAEHLHALAAIGLWLNERKTPDAPFTYRGRSFEIELAFGRGVQPSPFRDGTSSGANATVRNLDNGKRLTYALLVPHMIERYGFYEGKGTPYRVDPKAIVELLDFLKK
jgi:hypothetical protein